MKSVSFWVINILLIISTLGCSPGSSEHYYDPPTTTTTTNTSNIKSWNRASFPLVVYVPTEMNDYTQAVLNSQKTWNEALGFEAFRFVFNNASVLNTQWVGEYESLEDNILGLYKILSPNWNYSKVGSGVLAFTSTSTTQLGQIVKADILFNFQNYSFGDAGDGTYTAQFLIDFESVLTHELGHFLGLNHVSTIEDPNSVMLPKISRGVTKRQLSFGDLDRIRALYNIQ